MNKIKVILVDDHALFRDGIKSILDEEESIQVIDEAADAKMLFEKLGTNNPDLIITDISLPDISGIELTRQITKLYPSIKVLMLSMHNNDEFILSSLQAGAIGYLSKDINSNELMQAINAVMKGNLYFNKEISQTIINTYRESNSALNVRDQQFNLTERELEVVKLVAEGLVNKEIAEKLHISIRTVDAHKNHIMHKLNLKSTVEMVKYAIKNKLIKI